LYFIVTSLPSLVLGQWYAVYTGVPDEGFQGGRYSGCHRQAKGIQSSGSREVHFSCLKV
jgi:hypothetical protein